MALRSTLHQAGAAALGRLLQFPEPAVTRPLSRVTDPRRVLTAVGEAEPTRPYYLCPQCHHGQFPMDAELNVAHQAGSPGVRRMLARVVRRHPSTTDVDFDRHHFGMIIDMSSEYRHQVRNGYHHCLESAHREPPSRRRAF